MLKWMSWFSNKRLLEPIGYIPPAEAEANYWKQQAELASTTKSQRRRSRRVEPWVHGPTGGPPAAPAVKTQAANLTVRPHRPDSSQQESSKPGAVQSKLRCCR
jgi:hypothetical protein